MSSNSPQSMELGESSTSAMFAPNAPMVVTGGTFNVTHTRRRALNYKKHEDRHRRVIQESFKGHVALNVTHDTNDPVDAPRCHPKTRTAILQTLADWARTTDDSGSYPSHILWLFGPAEVGKSAIAGSFADVLCKEDRLAASFFFQEDALGINLEKRLVTTIAFQMAFSIPELQPYIASAVEKNPFIFHQSPETQVEQLIIAPILNCDFDKFRLQRTIIIDGLDKCGSQDAQRRILGIIGDAAPRLAGKIKFLILSRPELPIKSAFNLPTLKSVTHCMDLMDDLSAFNDIRIFLKDGFEKIKATRALHAVDIASSASWTEEEWIELLVFESYGSFGYARKALDFELKGQLQRYYLIPLLTLQHFRVASTAQIFFLPEITSPSRYLLSYSH